MAPQSRHSVPSLCHKSSSTTAIYTVSKPEASARMGQRTTCSYEGPERDQVGCDAHSRVTPRELLRTTGYGRDAATALCLFPVVFFNGIACVLLRSVGFTLGRTRSTETYVQKQQQLLGTPRARCPVGDGSSTKWMRCGTVVVTLSDGSSVFSGTVDHRSAPHSKRLHQDRHLRSICTTS